MGSIMIVRHSELRTHLRAADSRLLAVGTVMLRVGNRSASRPRRLMRLPCQQDCVT